MFSIVGAIRHEFTPAPLECSFREAVYRIEIILSISELTWKLCDPEALRPRPHREKKRGALELSPSLREGNDATHVPIENSDLPVAGLSLGVVTKVHSSTVPADIPTMILSTFQLQTHLELRWELRGACTGRLAPNPSEQQGRVTCTTEKHPQHFGAVREYRPPSRSW